MLVRIQRGCCQRSLQWFNDCSTPEVSIYVWMPAMGTSTMVSVAILVVDEGSSPALWLLQISTSYQQLAAEFIEILASHSDAGCKAVFDRDGLKVRFLPGKLSNRVPHAVLPPLVAVHHSIPPSVHPCKHFQKICHCMLACQTIMHSIYNLPFQPGLNNGVKS